MSAKDEVDVLCSIDNLKVAQAQARQVGWSSSEVDVNAFCFKHMLMGAQEQARRVGNMSAQVGVNCCSTRSKATIDGGLG